MACDVGAAFKVVELILCVVCLVYKRYTDNEAIRVFYHLEKISREWPLLNNVTWDENGALLADATFTGFALISLGLLVGQLSGELRAARRLVCFFLSLGCLMFLVVGGLCLAAVDQVPPQLVDNAVILGVLAIITALVFLLDLATSGNKRSSSSPGAKAVRTGKPVKVISAPIAVVEEKTEKKRAEDKIKKVDEKKPEGEKEKKNFGNGVLKELRSSLKRKKTVEDLDGRGVVVEKDERNVEFDTDLESTLEPLKLIGGADDSRQYGRRRLENRGFTRRASDDSGRFSSDRFVEAERGRRSDRDREHERFETRSVSVVEGMYDRRSRPPSMMEVELDEHYLRPQDYYIERQVTRDRDRDRDRDREDRDRERDRDRDRDRGDRDRERERERDRDREREERRLQDHRVSSSRQDLSDEDYYQTQLPSVSFLLSERGRKVLPSVTSSPVERLPDSKPRYYFNSSRDPAADTSAPASPRTPGYVLSTASQWETQSGQGHSQSVTERLNQWFRPRQPSKAP